MRALNLLKIVEPLSDLTSLNVTSHEKAGYPTDHPSTPFKNNAIEYVKIQALIYLQCVVTIFLVRVK